MPTPRAGWTPNRVATFLAVFAAWGLTRPYQGVIHDNTLYALQALRYLAPEILGSDLFFRYGSQDSFTVFSPLYAAVISLSGLAAATTMLTLLGQAMWLGAALMLVRSAVPIGSRAVAMLFVALMEPTYGPHRVFGYGEAFLTPRIFAEAFSMLAIGAFLSNRYRGWTAGALLAAAVLHPLIVPAPLAVILPLALARGRSVWCPLGMIACGMMAVPVILAAAYVMDWPFAVQIDTQWYGAFADRQPYLFVANWHVGDWLGFATAILLTGAAAICATEAVGRVLVVTGAVAIASVFVSFVGLDLMRDATVGALQLWRATWLVQLLAPVSVAVLLRQSQTFPSSGNSHRLMCALLLLLVAASSLPDFIPNRGMTFILGVVIFLKVLACRYFRPAAQRWAGYAAGAVLVLMPAVAILAVALGLAGFLALDDVVRSNLHPGPIILAFAPLALAGVAFMPEKARHASVLSAALALALMVVSAGFWDRRTEWRRYIDARPDILSEIGAGIGRSETVYWQDDATAVWFGLGRTSYVSHWQGGGAIFNRATAIELARRFRVVSALSLPARAIDQEDLWAVCTAKAPPDIFVLAQKVSGVPSLLWQAPVKLAVTQARSGTSGRLLADLVPVTISDRFVYRCANVRAATAGRR